MGTPVPAGVLAPEPAEAADPACACATAAEPISGLASAPAVEAELAVENTPASAPG
jgi:hypothetical protein